MAANGVKTRHTDYDLYSQKWRRCRDVVSGQDAIYYGSTLYLAKLAEETDPEYKKRQERTPFFNATWRTMAAFIGMMFRKPPAKTYPDKLQELLNDVTMSGVSFDNFAQDVALEDIMVSRVGVLVDYPNGNITNPDGTAITMAQAEVMGLRPSMVMYKAEQIINWRYEFINNHYTLTQVRLWEQHTEVESEFKDKKFAVIRVLDLINGHYRVRRFLEENESQIGWDIYPTMNGQPMEYIPFYFIGPDGGEPELSDPVLIDLVDLNIKHFQVSADFEHGCHMTGLPTPWIAGATPQSFAADGSPIWPKLYIGSMTAWMLPAGAETGYLEFNGQGLKALTDNLDKKEAQMAAIGAKMLTPEKTGVEAAETVAMRHAGENSILAAIAVAVSEGLTKALKVFAEWAGVPVTEDNIKFDINRDFMPFPMSPQALVALLATVQAAQLSSESLFDLMKRGDLIDAEISFEDEQARIDAAPAMPPPVAAPIGEEVPEPKNKGTEKPIEGKDK